MLSVLTGDALEQLRTLPDESVQCCVTSPPYWGLRDYGTAAWEGGTNECDHQTPPGISCGQRADRTFTLGEIYKDECGKCGAKRIDSQLGLEKTPEEYVAKMVEVFREVRRVLRKDGTLWLNLGDSYHTQGGSRTSCTNTLTGQGSRREAETDSSRSVPNGCKPKDLCGIPWRVAFALQADGWWLRSDIIWAKPNPMPESVTDRPTKAHEYLFLLTKASNYFYDAEAIREPELSPGRSEAEIERQRRNRPGNEFRKGELVNDSCGTWRGEGNYIGGRNKRSVWTVATAPYPEAHFATYPPDLIKPCIMSGTSAKGCCSKCGAPWERNLEIGESTYSKIGKNKGSDFGKNDSQPGNSGQTRDANGRVPLLVAASRKTLGWQPTCKCGQPDYLHRDFPLIPCTVLDPFAGSGTTGMVALELGRKAILIELNPKYRELIRQRCDVTPGLQLA